MALAVIALAYAAFIAVGNIQHVRGMPNAEREPLEALDRLPPQVSIVERAVSSDGTESGLGRADVYVEINRQAFPVSKQVWMQAAQPRSSRARYLNRFRAGLLRYGEDEPDFDESPLWMYMIELHQDFAQSGDRPRTNLWRFPVTRSAEGVLTVPQGATVRFAHSISVNEAAADDEWRALFADSYRRLVRAFPALAALIIGLAALGSLLFNLWRLQPWAVTATTVTFVLPLVSAAPFLSDFGWMPLVAAVVLGYIITTAVVCAIEQRWLENQRDRLRLTVTGRALEALAIPLAALLVGTTLVTSLASVSVIEWQGLGSASPGEIFMASLVRPALGLLIGGFSGCLLLAGFYAVLQWRIRTLLARD